MEEIFVNKWSEISLRYPNYILNSTVDLSQFFTDLITTMMNVATCTDYMSDDTLDKVVAHVNLIYVFVENISCFETVVLLNTDLNDIMEEMMDDILTYEAYEGIYNLKKIQLLLLQ